MINKQELKMKKVEVSGKGLEALEEMREDHQPFTDSDIVDTALDMYRACWSDEHTILTLSDVAQAYITEIRECLGDTLTDKELITAALGKYAQYIHAECDR